MEAEEKDHLRKKIAEHILKVESEIADLESMVQPIKPENSLGRISRMDAINNKAVNDAAMRNRKAKLTKLRVAAKNIDEDGFGLCTMCNSVIQPMRLMYMPESTRCVRCASR